MSAGLLEPAWWTPVNTQTSEGNKFHLPNGFILAENLVGLLFVFGVGFSWVSVPRKCLALVRGFDDPTIARYFLVENSDLRKQACDLTMRVDTPQVKRTTRPVLCTCRTTARLSLGYTPTSARSAAYPPGLTYSAYVHTYRRTHVHTYGVQVHMCARTHTYTRTHVTHVHNVHTCRLASPARVSRAAAR